MLLCYALCCEPLYRSYDHLHLQHSPFLAEIQYVLMLLGLPHPIL